LQKPLVRIKIEELGDELDNKMQPPTKTIKPEVSPSERKLIEADDAKFESFKGELSATKSEDTPISIVELDDSSNDFKKLDFNEVEKSDATKKNDVKSAESLSPRESSGPPALPSVPTTSYQFQMDWKMLKNHMEVFAEYVKVDFLNIFNENKHKRLL
jgi:hypothetical protein